MIASLAELAEITGGTDPRPDVFYVYECAFRSIRPPIPATSGHPYRGKGAERFGGVAGWTDNTAGVSESIKAAHAVRNDPNAIADLVAGELSRLGVRDRLGGSALVRFRVCDGSKQPRWQNLFVVGKAGTAARQHIVDVFGIDPAALEVEHITEFAKDAPKQPASAPQATTGEQPQPNPA
jgi:hypothetical protein